MTVDQMREKVAAAYDGWKWRDKVSRMADDQILALYFKFQNEGRLDRSVQLAADGTKPVQLSIEDL